MIRSLTCQNEHSWWMRSYMRGRNLWQNVTNNSSVCLDERCVSKEEDACSASADNSTQYVCTCLLSACHILYLCYDRQSLICSLLVTFSLDPLTSAYSRHYHYDDKVFITYGGVKEDKTRLYIYIWPKNGNPNMEIQQWR